VQWNCDSNGHASYAPDRHSLDWRWLELHAGFFDLHPQRLSGGRLELSCNHTHRNRRQQRARERYEFGIRYRWRTDQHGERYRQRSNNDHSGFRPEINKDPHRFLYSGTNRGGLHTDSLQQWRGVDEWNGERHRYASRKFDRDGPGWHRLELHTRLAH